MLAASLLSAPRKKNCDHSVSLELPLFHSLLLKQAQALVKESLRQDGAIVWDANCLCAPTKYWPPLSLLSLPLSSSLHMKQAEALVKEPLRQDGAIVWGA